MQREQIIDTWLNDQLQHQPFQLNYLLGDASFRHYARVQTAQGTYMLMDAPPEKEDCAPFVKIAEFLAQHGVRVPQIVAKDLKHGLLLLEDFGDVVLSTLLNPDTVDGYYTQSFEQLVQLQAVDATGFLPHYSHDKLVSEMRLFSDWLLPSLDIQCTAAHQAVINHAFEFLANSALSQPQVIVHRDFHSRNLMQLAGSTELGVIDFQDAVIGADTYDLISITRDAYVQWPVARVNAWFEQFYQCLPEADKQHRSLAQFKRDADLMAVQRHIKILGIFVRLFERDGKAGYLKDLPRVMWYVLQESQPYAELADLLQFLHDDVMPKFSTKYGTYEAIV